MLNRRNFLAKSSTIALSTVCGLTHAKAVGSGFSFFDDCGPFVTISKDDAVSMSRIDLQPFFVLEAVEVILALSQSYAIIKSNMSDPSAMLTQINSKLDDIRQKVDIINVKMDFLLAMLAQLPALVRGAVEETAIRQALGRCNGLVGNIQDKLKPQLIDQYADVIEASCDALHVELAGIKGIKGLSGVILTAPYLSAYLAGAVAAQKSKRRTNPNWVVNSPWNRTLVIETGVMLNNLMTAVEQVDAQYAVSAPLLPKHTARYDVTAGIFKKTPLGEYKLACPGTFTPEKLYRITGPTTPDQEVHSGPAYDALQEVLKDRLEINTFYSLMPQLYAARADLAQVFVEPAGIWS